MTNYLTIGLLGIVGIFSRWLIDSFFHQWTQIFPFGILIINVLGSFIAGVVYVVGAEKIVIPPQLSVALLVGFCGGFTTFSAYSLQAFLYIEKGNLYQGILYLCVSPILGLMGVFAGVYVARYVA